MFNMFVCFGWGKEYFDVFYGSWAEAVRQWVHLWFTLRTAGCRCHRISPVLVWIIERFQVDVRNTMVLVIFFWVILRTSWGPVIPHQTNLGNAQSFRIKLRGIEPLAWAFCGFVAWQQSEFACLKGKQFGCQETCKSRWFSTTVLPWRTLPPSVLVFTVPGGKA